MHTEEITDQKTGAKAGGALR